MSENIIDIELESIIRQAVGGDKKALDELVCRKEFNKMLDGIAAKTSREFWQVPSEVVRDNLFDKTYARITDIKNEDGIAWQACLGGWLKRIATNFCINYGKHVKHVDDHRKDVIGKNTACRRRSKGGGWKTVVANTDKSPQDELTATEAELEQEQQRLELRERILRALDSLLPPDRRDIGRYWLNKTSPVNISKMTGFSVASVYRIIKREVIPIVLAATNNPALFEDAPDQIKVLQTLLANSLLENTGQETARVKPRA